MMDNQPSLDWVFVAADRVGTVAILIVIVVGAVRRWWVPGWIYREQVAREREETAEWKHIARSANATLRQANATTGEVVTILRTKDGV